MRSIDVMLCAANHSRSPHPALDMAGTQCAVVPGGRDRVSPPADAHGTTVHLPGARTAFGTGRGAATSSRGSVSW
jgi:hypothetical protein